MNEERKTILKMLAEGKITVEEAEKLLQALEESSKERPSSKGHAEGKSGRNFFGGAGFHFDFDEFGKAFGKFDKLFSKSFGDAFRGCNCFFGDVKSHVKHANTKNRRNKNE